MMFILMFIVLIMLKSGQAIIGFDCGSTDPEIQTFSLVDNGNCEFDDNGIKIGNATIQLLQQAEFKFVHTRQCKIEIKRLIYNCGMFSHLSPVENSVQEYLYYISEERCKEIHETGVFRYDNFHIFSDLKINSSRSIPMVFAGTVDGNSCTGAAFSDKFGTWKNVIVQGLIKITLRDEFAKVSLSDDKLQLSSGTVCRFSDQHCIDLQAGYAFWPVLSKENCFLNKYDVLYGGLVTKVITNNNETIYTINTGEISFSLAVTEKISLCNRIITKTEHPKLFIYDKQENLLFNNDIRVHHEVHADLFTYINSKFIFVERHFRTQLKKLYLNMLKERCQLEQQVIQNSLSLASISPDLFAYDLMKKPGFIARLAGEVVHVIKCVPVIVSIVHTNECYTQLPVKTGNKTMFLSPKTHILLKTGVQINCDSIIPQYYKIDNTWISLMPRPTKVHNTVQVWKTHKKINWKPEGISNLGSSGIYTQQDLDDYQRHLMFPMEKTSLLNTIARGMQGEENVQGELIENLLTTSTLKNIAENTWNFIINKLIEYGSISSSLFMLGLIIGMLKLLIDTTIRGYTIHAVYGWSLHLLGALFSSVTHLLITLKNNDRRSSFSKRMSYCETPYPGRRDDASLREFMKKTISAPSSLNESTVIDMELKDLSNLSINNSHNESSKLPLPRLPPNANSHGDIVNSTSINIKENTSFFSLEPL